LRRGKKRKVQTERYTSAFRGQTPDEMYFGHGDEVPGELQSANEIARKKRLERNRGLSCAVCEPPNAA